MMKYGDRVIIWVGAFQQFATVQSVDLVGGKVLVATNNGIWSWRMIASISLA
jgi:hypothetical protein